MKLRGAAPVSAALPRTPRLSVTENVAHTHPSKIPHKNRRRPDIRSAAVSYYGKSEEVRSHDRQSFGAFQNLDFIPQERRFLKPKLGGGFLHLLAQACDLRRPLLGGQLRR